MNSNTSGHLIVVDRHYLLATVDAEAGNDVEPGNLLLLPEDATSDGDQIELIERSSNGTLYRSVRPGLARATLPTNNSGVVVRVSRYQYAGLARYRHLEETPND